MRSCHFSRSSTIVDDPITSRNRIVGRLRTIDDPSTANFLISDYDRLRSYMTAFLLICPATDRRWPFTTIDGSIRSYYEVSQSYLIVTKNRRIDYWPSNCSRPSPTNYHFASVFSSATDRRWSLPFRNCPFRCLRIIDRRWSYMVVENFVVTDRITIRLRSSP